MKQSLEESYKWFAPLSAKTGDKGCRRAKRD